MRVQQTAVSADAFTLIELLVVIVIIVILVTAVVVASSTMITKAKVSNTQAMLTIVRDAVEQFKREQTASPTIARDTDYRNRYAYWPPDELEVFTPVGIPGGAPGTRAPGEAVMVPPATPEEPYEAMSFYTQGLPNEDQASEFRDQAAMVVAIEILGDTSAAILDRLDKRYRRAPLDPDGNPSVFLDRPDPDDPTVGPDFAWDTNAHQVRYVVDDWGNPISYLAQRDWEPPPAAPVSSTNLPASATNGGWNEAATRLVRLNAGQPVIFSYGPNGKDQLTAEQMSNNAAASLVGDFLGVGGEQDQEGRIDNHLNADNIYADPTLKGKLLKGIP